MSQGFYYEASFGGVLFDVLNATTEHPPRVATHVYPKRDGANLEEMGRAPFVCTMQIVFFDRLPRRGEAQTLPGYQERFESFDLLVQDGGVQTLVHPYVGAIRAVITDFSHQADGDVDGIAATVTFTEEISEPPVFEVGASSTTTAGSQEVLAGAVGVDDALSAEGFESGVTGDAFDTVQRWELDPDISTRQVHLEMVAINDRLNTELTNYETGFGLATHPIMRQYALLQHNIRRAAAAFTAESDRIVRINVIQELPLRVIAARFYSAKEASKRVQQLLELNPDLKKPAQVPIGTRLKAYAKRSGTRRTIGL